MDVEDSASTDTSENGHTDSDQDEREEEGNDHEEVTNDVKNPDPDYVNPFEDDDHPLKVLLQARSDLTHQTADLEKRRLVDQYEDGLFSTLQDTINRTGEDLKNSGTYLTTASEVLRAVSDIMKKSTEALHKKLKKEFVPFIPGDRKMTDKEKRILMRNTEAYKAYAQAAQQLAKMLTLAKEIDKSFNKVAAEVARAEQEARDAERALEAARRQAEEEAERQRREEEEERARREAEEARKREEEERKRQAEEEERQRKEREAEEERQRKEEENRRRLEEEERRRKEEEERKQRELEERRRKEEEEARLREERKKNDPANWPIFVYNIPVTEDALDSGVGCAVRAKQGSLQKDQLEVSLIDPLQSGVTLSENQEFMGNIIHIKSKEEALDFDPPMHVALPHLVIRGQVGNTRDFIIKARFGDGQWQDLESNEFSLPERKELKWVDSAIAHLDNLSVVVVSQLKVDRGHFNQRGGQLVSSVDRRIILSVPKEAFRLSTDVSMTVQTLDSPFLADLKGRHESCRSLTGTSHLVHLHTDRKPAVPLQLCIPTPSGGARRPKTASGGQHAGDSLRPATSSAASRPKSAWSAQQAKGDSSRDVLLVVTKDQNGYWHCEPENSVSFRRDLAFLDMEHVPQRCILLRTQEETTAQDGQAIARLVEQCLQERVVNMVVRQKEDPHMSSVYVECCRREKTEQTLHELNENGYTCGPLVSPDLVLREGQKISIDFSNKGNITFDGIEPPQFIFQNNMKKCFEFFVMVVDEYAQHGIDCYRGMMQFFTLQSTRKSRLRSESQVALSREKKDDVQEKSTAEVSDSPVNLVKEELICQMPITLPKIRKDKTFIHRAPVKISTSGPLSEEYFNELAIDLGDEWLILADYLGVSKGKVQAILQRHDQRSEASIVEMLTLWYKTSQKSADRVEELCWALTDASRQDLATELMEKNKRYEEIRLKGRHEERMDQAFRALTGYRSVLKDWKILGRHLDLPESTLDDIDANQGSLVGCCYKMLHTWQESRERNATIKALRMTLKNIGNKPAAEEMKRFA